MKSFTIANGALSLTAIEFGGSVTSLMVPDRAGRTTNVLLALPTPDDYAKTQPHLGALVGRYANRIAGGRLAIDGTMYQLPINSGPNTLHGGPGGFSKRLWQITPLSSSALELRLTSDDGDQGFPGRLHVRVQYSLPDDRAWKIDYEAQCEASTVVNLSQHAYFNLAGTGDILDHELTIAAQRYCAVDANLIPEAIEEVAGTPFDFRTPTAVGARIREPDVQLQRAGGYDHNWVLDGEGLRHVATVHDPASGRKMEVHTTQPGLQFYSGNFLDGSVGGLAHRSGLCLETQHFPDSPNHPAFPSTLLRPGETFRSTTLYRFS